MDLKHYFLAGRVFCSHSTDIFFSQLFSSVDFWHFLNTILWFFKVFIFVFCLETAVLYIGYLFLAYIQLRVEAWRYSTNAKSILGVRRCRAWLVLWWVASLGVKISGKLRTLFGIEASCLCSVKGERPPSTLCVAAHKPSKSSK